jgi:hypothetical protein
MVNRGLSKEEKSKFNIFFKTWFNSQNQYKLNDISKKVNIPVSSLYDYLRYNKSPNNIEKANAIINFIKQNQQEPAKIPYILDNSLDAENDSNNLRDNSVFLCQINEFNDALIKLQSSIETFQNYANSKKTSPKKQQPSELNRHLSNLELSLLSLYSELLWFKNSSSEDRKVLRKSLNSKDIGYITSLLRSIIKGEEEFNDWIVATTYQLEMVKWKKQH